MTDIGETTYGVCICAAITNAGGTSAYPDATGDRLFFIPTEIGGTDEFMQKIRQTAGGNSYATKDGKRKTNVQLSNCFIVKSTFSNMLQWFKSHHRQGQAPFYLFIKDLTQGAPNWGNANNTYQIGQLSDGTALNYLKCYAERVPWNIKAAAHYISQLSLIECLLG